MKNLSVLKKFLGALLAVGMAALPMLVSAETAPVADARCCGTGAHPIG